MKLLTTSCVLWQLQCLCFGTHFGTHSIVYYFDCKFDDNQVKPLITNGYQFYKYLQQDPELWKEYSKHMNPEDKDHGSDYLNRNYSKGHNELHTTMFYGKTAADREAYEQQPVVQNALNQPFQLDIYGVFITPSTMGFRIALPKEALPLWKANDKPGPLQPSVCADIEKFADSSLPEPDASSVFAPSNFTKGSRAHATVLTSNLAHPVQTGLDLVDIEYCEQNCRKNPQYRQVQLANGWNAKMRYYGFGRFVFYLDEQFPVATKFFKVEI